MTKRLGRLKNEAFEEPSVNLTPLIDVVFVILIGFILIAPLLEMDHVELASAPPSAPLAPHSVQEASPISIYVRQDNTVWLDGNQILIPRLPVLLKEAKMRYPNATPQLLHDRRAFFGTYQEVKNALEMAGFEKIDVILKPQ